MEGLIKKTQENNIEKSQIKEGVEFVFQRNPELSQIGTMKQYSEYLDTVFPESVFQDIVYHGTNAKESFDHFDLNKGPRTMRNLGAGIYFSDNTSLQNKYANFGEGRTVCSLINTKKPFITASTYNERFGAYYLLENDEFFTKYLDNDSIFNYIELDMDKLAPCNKYFIKYTGELINNFPTRQEYSSPKIYEILIPSKEQIHILGSSQDLESFKKFVEKSEGSHDSLITRPE